MQAQMSKKGRCVSIRTFVLCDMEVRRLTASFFNSCEEKGNMYTEWTKIILDEYSQYEEAIQDNIERILNRDGYVADESTIKKVSKIWWISLCAVGRGGILHPYKQKIDPDTLRTIADAAGVSVNNLISSITITDSHMSKCDSGEMEPNGIELYILPIYVTAYSIDKNYDMNAYFRLPESDLFNAIGKIGIKALDVGGEAWVRVVGFSWNNVVGKNGE